MKRLGSVLSFLFSVACLAFFAGVVNNVYGDPGEVNRLAHQTACGDRRPHCNANMTQWSRDAMGQSFTFVIANRTVPVTCRRELHVVGEYRCMAPFDMEQARADRLAPSAAIH
jgi:hypothetical protein